jgi:hypothetical protein
MFANVEEMDPCLGIVLCLLACVFLMAIIYGVGHVPRGPGDDL